MNTIKNTYFLVPNDSHKSFYGKAKVRVYADGTEILQSYDTDIIKKTRSGEYIRLWDGWSATTGRHIKAYTGLNKAGYFNLPDTEAAEAIPA